MRERAAELDETGTWQLSIQFSPLADQGPAASPDSTAMANLHTFAALDISLGPGL